MAPTNLIEQSRVIQGAVERGLLVPATELDSQPYGYFYDLDGYKSNLRRLREAFPGHWHHAIAVKTNPLAGVLKIAQAQGHGTECASIGEVIHSLEMGFAGPDVVFDCPCKTIPELKHALANKVMTNLDNMQELDRVQALWADMSPEARDGCVIGLRINPLVGAGAVANLSVSTSGSKFGVVCPGETSEVLLDRRAAVIKALVANDFINAIHVHTGSGGMTTAQMAEGAANAAHLALEVNKLRGPGKRAIEVIDIGGGLPVSWGKEQNPTFEQYSAELKAKAPSLFDGTFRRVVTEMGATLNCRFGLFASLCEVTKPTETGNIAMIHVGSEQFMRACYAPQMRAAHPVKVYDAAGKPKVGPMIQHDIAGPLCFAGDIVRSGITLPKVEVGDIIVLEEAGGNTHSLRTTHCSRRAPPVYGYQQSQSGFDGLWFTVLNDGSSYADVCSVWRQSTAKLRRRNPNLECDEEVPRAKARKTDKCLNSDSEEALTTEFDTGTVM